MRSTNFEKNVEIKVTDRRGENKQPDPMAAPAAMSQYETEAAEKTLEELIAECPMSPGPCRVVVHPDRFKYRGRMIIPKTAERVGTTGIILKVGYGCECQFFDEKLQLFRELRPGDKVAYGTWTGTQFTFDQRPSYRVLAETEIATLLNQTHTKLLDVEA